MADGIELHALTCGWLEASLGLFVAGEQGRIRVPVPSFLIRHPRGAVVFDTGLHLETQHDPEARVGAIARVFQISFTPGQELAAQLARLDVDPGQVRWLVSSHLHFDHVGGNAQLPGACWLLQRREWEAAGDADWRARNFVDPRDYDLGHDRLLADGEHDLFGDGSLVCLPTFGHTPGHQSLRVRGALRPDGTPVGEIVLTADACYLRRTLADGVLPPSVHDADAMRASLARLRALREGGARLVFGHEPDGWPPAL
jgi:glyoxylase-like metal-dependent hydrolase (beta-lactamase superfamily II)